MRAQVFARRRLEHTAELIAAVVVDTRNLAIADRSRSASYDSPSGGI